MKKLTDNIWLRLLLLTLIWSSAVVSFIGWPRAWGLIPLGTDEGAWRLVAGLLCTILLFSAKTEGKWISRVKERLFLPSCCKNGLFPKILILGFAYFFLVLFAWYFRSRNLFMGDGWAFAENVAKPFYLYKNEPLDFFIHQLLYRFLRWSDLGNGETAYQVLHCFLFPVFLWTCWKIAGLASRTSPDRIIIFTLTTATTSLQLFFGYVESYTLLHLWLSLFLYSGLTYFDSEERGRVPWVPSLLFIMATATHLSAVVLMPAVLFLWLEGLLSKRLTHRWFNPVGVVFLVCCLMLSLLLIVFKGGPILPVFELAPGVPYRLFDYAHLWDKLNFLLLVCPVAALAIPLAAARFRFIIKSVNTSFIFISWCVAGSLFFFFVINPALGIRDWDLFSLPAVPLALWSGYFLTRVLQDSTGRTRFLLALSLASVVHTATWIRINSDLDRGVRFLDRVCLVDFHKGSSKVQLGSLMCEKGYFKESIRQYRAVNVERWKSRSVMNIGSSFLGLDMPDSTLYYYRPYFGLAMSNVGAKQAYIDLMVSYDMLGYLDSAAVMFLNMKKAGLELDKKKRLWLINRMGLMAGRKYNDEIRNNLRDVYLIMFYLRFHTIKQDQDKLDEAYTFILQNTYPKIDWIKLVDFASTCGHSKYLRPLIEKATEQYPELKKRWKVEKVKSGSP
jgi:hypothetical protein